MSVDKTIRKLKSTPKKIKTKQEKSQGADKRFVKTVKVFLTDEERDMILEKAYEYGGVSNYIRHHLGLPMNILGRKRKSTEAAFDVNSLLEDE